MLYKDNRFDIAVYDQSAAKERGNDGIVSSGVLAFVFVAGTKTLATLYSDTERTALTNPISRSQFGTDGQLAFYTQESSVDIYLAHSDGSCGLYLAKDKYCHSLGLDRSGIDKCLITTFADSDNTEVDTGLDFPVGAWVYRAGAYVRTVDATETVSFGILSTETGGDTDGLISGLSVATAGWVEPYTVTAGGNESYVSADFYGPLMGNLQVGSDVAGQAGSHLPRGHHVAGSNGRSLVYAGSAGSDTAAGEAYFWFKQLPL